MRYALKPALLPGHVSEGPARGSSHRGPFLTAQCSDSRHRLAERSNGQSLVIRKLREVGSGQFFGHEIIIHEAVYRRLIPKLGVLLGYDSHGKDPNMDSPLKGKSAGGCG